VDVLEHETSLQLLEPECISLAHGAASIDPGDTSDNTDGTDEAARYSGMGRRIGGDRGSTSGTAW